MEGDKMETVKIYLSGSMSDVSWEEQTKWRKQFQDEIKFGDHDYKKKPIFFDPTRFYNFEEEKQKSEREIMEFDLYNLRQSDVVVVNINSMKSLGTMSELILAYEYRIPVIGWVSTDEPMHPWVECCMTRKCNDIREAVNYLIEFYLN